MDQMLGTALLLLIISAVTDGKNMKVNSSLVPLLIGLGLTAIHLRYIMSSHHSFIHSNGIIVISILIRFVTIAVVINIIIFIMIVIIIIVITIHQVLKFFLLL